MPPSTILPALDNSTRIPDVYSDRPGNRFAGIREGRGEEGKGLSALSISREFEPLSTLLDAFTFTLSLILTDRLLFFNE